ncbi:MAG: sugar transferase [Candidatus Marinimicrobia bacterium]|nr:sugar transferase [Candidatus Neomarinimicrobiota bacterium]
MFKEYYKWCRMSLYYEKIKRAIDILLSLVAIIFLFPVGLLIAIAIKIDSKGSVIHKTKRLGKNGSFFIKYKFRTMIPNGEEVLQRLLESNPKLREEYESNYKIRNDPRVTRVGKFLRKTSLDELPQFFNILKGEMSLVGPRDVIPPELEKHYGYCKEKFLSVKPGLTGLWQVSGRSKLPYEKRVELDMYYIDHRSLWLDLKILIKTIPAVIKGDGAV